MAVQVIGSIPETDAKLKNATTAELAKRLLGLYAAVPREKQREGGKRKNEKEENEEKDEEDEGDE
jgi:hypothetical protein